MNQLCERVNSIEAKLEEISAMKETFPKLEITILAKYRDRMTTYQELGYAKLDLIYPHP